jgi:catechol 2,3-dioxygenase-like lactoylglutathione lyase family enzyme
MHGITGIDHPVIAVRDLAGARLTYQRLGFTISGRGTHLEWGTGNFCVMLARGYLELVGVVDASRYTHGLDEYLRTREGLAGVAFGTDDADATFHSLVAAGVGVESPREVKRNLETPAGIRQPRFSVCFLDRSRTPGLPSTAICQHLTPELLQHADWGEHRNGTIDLVSINLPLSNFEAAIESYRTVFGEESLRRAPLSAEIRLGSGAVIHLASRCGAEVLTLAVKDIASARRSMKESGVPFTTPASNALLVPPEYACGVAINFVEQTKSS